MKDITSKSRLSEDGALIRRTFVRTVSFPNRNSLIGFSTRSRSISSGVP
jgi:hypothetical protein